MMHVNRIVPTWNSSLDEIVPLTALDGFKYHLDKFWSSQEIKKIGGLTLPELGLSV